MDVHGALLQLQPQGAHTLSVLNQSVTLARSWSFSVIAFFAAGSILSLFYPMGSVFLFTSHLHERQAADTRTRHTSTDRDEHRHHQRPKCFCFNVDVYSLKYVSCGKREHAPVKLDTCNF